MGLWIQNFKQALRGLRHQGWQAMVSVSGLAVSIVCLTFSVNWLWTETHYDSFRPGYKDLYVVEREDSLEHTESLLYRWGDRVSSVLGKEAMVGMYRYQGGGNVFTCRIVPKRFLCARAVCIYGDGSLVGMPCSFRFA